MGAWAIRVNGRKARELAWSGGIENRESRLEQAR